MKLKNALGFAAQILGICLAIYGCVQLGKQISELKAKLK